MDSLPPSFDISKIPVKLDQPGHKPYDHFEGIGEFKKQPEPNNRFSKTRQTVGSLTAAAGVSLAALAGISNVQSADIPKPPPIVTPQPTDSKPDFESYVTRTATPTESPTQTPTKTATNTATASPTASPSPTATATKEPTPSPTPEKDNVGDKNLAEYLLGDKIDEYMQIRQERYANDPAFRERMISEEIIKSNRINFLYLGLDQTRDRMNEFQSVGIQGKGLADSFMIISFDPHTFKTTVISLPRDLCAPDMIGVYPTWPKINTLANPPSNMSPNDVSRQVVETVTGLPVDAIVKTNIDFMKDFLTEMFPEGLELDVKNRIVDTEYPTANYGVKTVTFEKGKQMIKGEKLVEYGRTRHADSAFGREARQRDILSAALGQFWPDILKAAVAGDTTLIDKIITDLEKQESNKNLFYDESGNIIDILKTIRQKMQKTNLFDKGKIGVNSASVIKNFVTDRANMFTSYGLTTANGAVVDPSFPSYVLVPEGSNPRAKPTELGNYMRYWQPIREKVAELIP